MHLIALGSALLLQQLKLAYHPGLSKLWANGQATASPSTLELHPLYFRKFPVYWPCQALQDRECGTQYKDAVPIVSHSYFVTLAVFGIYFGCTPATSIRTWQAGWGPSPTLASLPWVGHAPHSLAHPLHCRVCCWHPYCITYFRVCCCHPHCIFTYWGVLLPPLLHYRLF